jgi:hypothetical protein
MTVARTRLLPLAAALCLAVPGFGNAAAEGADEMGLEAGARVAFELADGRKLTGTLVTVGNNQGQRTGVGDEFQIQHSDGMQVVHGYWKDYMSIVSTGSEDPASKYEFTRGDGIVFQGDTWGIVTFEIDLGLAKKGFFMGQDIKSIKVGGGDVTPSKDGTQVTLMCPHCGKPITVRVKADK